MLNYTDLHISFSQVWFTLKCMFPTWDDWAIEYSGKAKMKKRVLDGLKYSTLPALAVVAYKMSFSDCTSFAPAVSNLVRKFVVDGYY